MSGSHVAMLLFLALFWVQDCNMGFQIIHALNFFVTVGALFGFWVHVDGFDVAFAMFLLGKHQETQRTLGLEHGDTILHNLNLKQGARFCTIEAHRNMKMAKLVCIT